MEQPGEAPEPEQPVGPDDHHRQPSIPLPPPTPPGDGAPDAPADPLDDGITRRGFLVAGVLVLVAVTGVLAWMARPDDALETVARTDQRFPAPTTAAPVTTAPAATTVGIAPPVSVTEAAPLESPTVTPAPTPAATPPPTPVVTPSPSAPAPTVPAAPGGAPVVPTTTTDEPVEEPALVAQLVPSLAGLADAPSSAELDTRLDELRTAGRHDVAVTGPVAAVCATVPLDRPIALGGRWERDGRRIASTDVERRDAPGYGECLTDDGGPLEDGSYQYVAADSDGAESAAGGLVVGAPRLEQRFFNNAPVPICAIRIAPRMSRYFEVYLYDAAPIAEGTTVTLAVAGVEQDVETVRCDRDEVVSRFSFDPAGTAQPLDP